MPADGVLRPIRYTLENYLLEPEGWFAVVKLVHRRVLPPDWDSVDAVHERVLDAYRTCLPVSAFNATVQQEYGRLASDPTGARFGYKQHPNAIDTPTLATLDAWGAARGAPRALRDVYDDELARLSTASFAEWQFRVTGKAVLKVFQAGFPGVTARHLLDNLYLDKHPQPPEDLTRLVQRVLAA